MSVDRDPTEPTHPIPLRREALLPSERGRGLGTVAVVCTMAGVASGLALATTLMAMQVAESMQMRPTAYVTVEPTPVETDTGFLGIYYHCNDGVCEISGVEQDTPAYHVGLRAGDRVKLIDGGAIRSESELKAHVAGSPPGTHLEIVIERDGADQTVHPILRARPARRS